MKTQIKLLISVGLALLVTFLFWFSLERTKRSVVAQTNLVPVLYAKRYIKKGRPLTKDVVRVNHIPEAFREPNAIPGMAVLVNEKGESRFKARIGLLKGSQITTTGLIDEEVQLGLAWVLETGEVATTLRLPLEKAVGGWLNPGDRVNVLNIIDNQRNTSSSSASTLLERVQVIAVNERRWTPLTPLDERHKPKTMENEAVLVTIRVEPKESALLHAAARRGDIHLVLVSPIEKRE